MSDGYYTLDRDWRFSYLNRHARITLGGDWTGTCVWDAFPDTLGTALERELRAAMRDRITASFPYYFEPLDLHCEVRVYPMLDGLAVYFLDTTARYEAEQAREQLLVAEREARADAEAAQIGLRRQATHDTLTGLLNREGLRRAVGHPVLTSADTSIALLFVDVDNFKFVNDTSGHAVGDTLLAAAARRLTSVVPADALLARFGGDEFVVVVRDATPAEVDLCVARVVASSRQPSTATTTSLPVTVSVGVAYDDTGTADLDRLLREADAAMYRAKSAGRDRATWFDASMHTELLERVETERDLRTGIGDGQLRLHYQPAFDLRSGAVVDVECLVRWQHPERGMVPPLAFIPIAEESGLIVPLGDWVIQDAARQLAEWRDVGDVRVWVNVSARQVEQADFVDRLLRSLDRAGADPARFGVEITESMLVDDVGLSTQLTTLRRHDVAVAIDDFGTGYSSLARLSHQPVDLTKIDRSFVARCAEPRGRDLLDGITSLAHALGARAIAEGVETPEQLATVTAAGCDSASGYLLARPVPSEQVTFGASELVRPGGATFDDRLEGDGSEPGRPRAHAH